MNTKIKKTIPVVLVVITAIVILFGIISLVKKAFIKTSASSADSRIEVVGPKKTADVSKDFNFPLNGTNGKKITDIKFSVDTAELRDEIIVQGKRASAIQGRTFLILNLKIVSSFKQGLNITTRDYFRLTLNGKDADLIAPDIHNDPVVVEPMSSKFTRLGWPVNDSDKNMVLIVGQLNGPKTKIPLTLK